MNTETHTDTDTYGHWSTHTALKALIAACVFCYTKPAEKLAYIYGIMVVFESNYLYCSDPIVNILVRNSKL